MIICKNRELKTKTKLVIFDMDGLLFDTEKLFMETQAPILEKYGYKQRKENYVKTLGIAGENLKRTLYDIYGSDYPDEIISSETRKQVNYIIEKNGVQIKPGIKELLQALFAANIPCVVASSTKTEIVLKYLKRAGIDKYFSFVIGGDKVNESKPNPEIFLKAWKSVDVPLEAALILEDSENGLLASKNANMSSICIPDLKFPEPEYESIPAYIVETGLDVIDILGILMSFIFVN